MKVFYEIKEWLAHRPGDLGFVPTMGALHAGHLRLVEVSRAACAQTVVSLFVNPTQFDDPNDLRAYPRALEGDLKLLKEAGLDYVLVPTPEQIYPRGYRYRVVEQEDSRRLCGAHRQGHFDGVLTVVLKLLNLVRPRRAYFGEKDYQQLRLIQGMVEDFFLDVEIIPVPTVREEDGLALSSRNLRLDGPARRKAAFFPRALRQGGSPAQVAQRLRESDLEVDYVEDWEGRRLAAVRVPSAGGVVRLIDNVPL